MPLKSNVGRRKINSKVLSRDMRSRIWSALKEQGFSHFTTRTAWRYHPDRIDVINFQSFNSNNAAVIGCSTLSFAVNLGCFLLYVPYEHGITNVKDKDGLLRPGEAQCHLRGRIKPSDHRSLFERIFKKGAPNDIWLIREDGSNVESVLEEVRDALQDNGLKWFHRFDRREDVLRIFTSVPEEMGELWGFGNSPSPHRSYCIGYTALALGHYNIALPHLQSALSSGCFKLVEKQLRTNLGAAAQPIISPDAER